ncbi:MAG TPA: DUF2884 family protein [Pseudoxanthomonas sp.]|nr:DUF2884 family protein [Pseudoxanthomonas sp.]
MNFVIRKSQTLLALAVVVLLSACDPSTTVASDTGRVTAKADRVTLSADGQPKAEITGEGEFVIDGRKIEVTDAQRALLLDYKREFNAMTQDGIAMGKEGMAMAGDAVAAAVKGAFSGQSDSGNGEEVDKSMEARAREMENKARDLCRRMVAIKSTQDALAAALPAFRPYANIVIKGVEDCGKNLDTGPGGEPAAEPADAAVAGAPAKQA